jgi:hypothetical protein
MMIRILTMSFSVVLMTACASSDQGQEDETKGNTRLAVEHVQEHPSESGARQQNLRVLSDRYGLCSLGSFPDSRWTTSTNYQFSSGELIALEGDRRHVVSFSSGPVSVPGVELTGVNDKNPGSRIRRGAYGPVGVLVVDRLGPEQFARIWIEYEAVDAVARERALQLARSVLACKVVAIGRTG